MGMFEYQALTRAGQSMRGTIEAASTDQARESLAEMGLSVQEIGEAPRRRPRTRIGRSEFLLFNQQLASIAKAGLPLERGLRELSADVESPSLRRLIAELADDLEAGVGIEEAFESRGRSFPPLYRHIIRAGVTSGRLSEMLTSLNRHLEMSGRTRRILLESLSYPAVVFALAAVILTFVFGFVIPEFEAIYAGMAECLPGMTRFFLGLGDKVVPFWIGVGAVVAAIVAMVLLLRGFPGGRRFLEAFGFHIPILGRIQQRSLLSRLSDAMGLLVGAGCDMPSVLRLAAAATGSETMVTECEAIAQRVEQGEPIVDAGRDSRAIPPLFLYSVQLGADRNELKDNLYSLSEMYDEQVRVHQSRLQALLLPLMLIVVGGIIGLAVIAMFMPMVGVLDALQM